MSDTELEPLVINTVMLNRWGKTNRLMEEIAVALDQGRRVIFTDEKVTPSNVHQLVGLTPPAMLADATGLERKCDIAPTPFTRTTPRQRANKGAKWYASVRKGRREW